MAQRFFNPAPQYFYSGTPAAPLSGGLMYFYEPGTSTPKDTYSDNGLSTPNTNPVVLSASGVLPNVFLNGAYRVILQDKDGVQQPGWPRDAVNSIQDIAFSAWDSTVAYGAGGSNIVYASDTNYYVSIQANNTNHEPSANPLWWTNAWDYFATAQLKVAVGEVAVGHASTGIDGTAITAGYTAIGNATTALAGINTTTKGTIAAGTGATTGLLAVGTNGQYLSAASGQSTGLQWISPPAAITNLQEFSSSDTWEKPAGCVSVLVEMWGGGGGGAGQASADAGGGGGGGFTMVLLDAADCAATESVTIGAGGAGGTAAGGSAGGNTTFGSLATARGGAGGTLNTTGALSGDYVGGLASTSSWASGGGAPTSGGTAGIAGGACIMGGGGGGGGDSVSSGLGGVSLHGGNGGDGRTTTGTATAGDVPGGGGGGAYDGTGGAGAAGYARITAW